MTDVEIVALWSGLLTGVASIVLSIVAISAAVLADRRSSRISERVVESLQKIETTVGQQSDDTRQLIKAAWDKLLGAVDYNAAVDKSAVDLGGSSAKALAQGIAAELREELRPVEAGATGDGVKSTQPADDRVAAAIAKLESSLEPLLRRANAIQTSAPLDSLINTIRSLSPEAEALLLAIRRHHLSRKQYQQLERSAFVGPAIGELRKQGLIVPVQHEYGGQTLPCYFFPPTLTKLISAAVPLLDPISEDIEKRVQSELKATGYPHHDEPPAHSSRL